MNALLLLPHWRVLVRHFAPRALGFIASANQGLSDILGAPRDGLNYPSGIAYDASVYLGDVANNSDSALVSSVADAAMYYSAISSGVLEGAASIVGLLDGPTLRWQNRHSPPDAYSGKPLPTWSLSHAAGVDGAELSSAASQATLAEQTALRTIAIAAHRRRVKHAVRSADSRDLRICTHPTVRRMVALPAGSKSPGCAKWPRVRDCDAKPLWTLNTLNPNSLDFS